MGLAPAAQNGPRAPSLGGAAHPAGSTGRTAVPAADGPRAPPPLGRWRLGQVEISAFKPARANQGLARPQVQTRAEAGLPRPPPRHWRGGGEPAASVTGSNTDASSYRHPGPAGAGPLPWSAPCTASPSGAGAPTRACPSTSPLLVSARGGCRQGLLHPARSAQRGQPPRGGR